MGRKLLLINLFCLVGVALLSQQLVSSWDQFQEEIPRAPVVQGREMDVAPPGSLDFAEPISRFLIISEKNLFSADRSPEADPALEEEEAPPELPGDPQLLSVFAVGGEKEAILNVPQGRRGRQTTKQQVRIGDDVLGYSVTEIEDTYVVLSWKEHEVVVEMAEAGPEAPKSKPAQQAVNIITIGSAGAAVETTQASSAEEEGRGVEVAVAAAAAGAGGRAGSAMGRSGLAGGMAGQGMGRSGMGRSSMGMSGSRGMTGGMGSMGTFGGGTQRSTPGMNRTNQRPYR